MVRAFQAATLALRYSAGAGGRRAPRASTLGGGCEIALHADRVQAAAESYIGLVEVGVGLDSGRRRHEGDAGAGDGRSLPRGARICCRSCSPCSKRSGSRRSRRARQHARQLGYLRDDRRGHDEPRTADGGRESAGARARPRGIPAAGCRTAIPVGGEGVLAALKLGVHLAWRAGRISDHDALDRPGAGSHPGGRCRCRIRRR